jgi:hypothetical protein
MESGTSLRPGLFPSVAFLGVLHPGRVRFTREGFSGVADLCPMTR